MCCIKNVFSSAYCAADGTSEATEPKTDFYHYWNKQKTVPFFLVIIIFPLMNIKSPTFFTKFNVVGMFFMISLCIWFVDS